MQLIFDLYSGQGQAVSEIRRSHAGQRPLGHFGTIGLPQISIFGSGCVLASFWERFGECQYAFVVGQLSRSVAEREFKGRFFSPPATYIALTEPPRGLSGSVRVGEFKLSRA